MLFTLKATKVFYPVKYMIINKNILIEMTIPIRIFIDI